MQKKLKLIDKINILRVLAVLVLFFGIYYLLASDIENYNIFPASIVESEKQSVETQYSHLLLPDLVAKPAGLLEIKINSENKHRELFFETTVINIGEGPLEMLGEYDKETDKTRATQRLKARDNKDDFEEIIAGYFIFHEGHDHWHFEDFVEINIFPYGKDGTLGEVLVTSGKMTFCIFDYSIADSSLPGAPKEAVYPECQPDIQGLSVGWADTYSSKTLGQQVDIENLKNGLYAIYTTADPAGRILEKNAGNNSAVIYVEINGSSVKEVKNE